MVEIQSALVIDDNSEALNLIGQVLASAGVGSVCKAHSAEEALEILLTRSFQLLIADYRLEGMNGVEFLETLRASGDLTPLLLLTGAPDKAGVIRAVSQPNVGREMVASRVMRFFGAPSGNKLVTHVINGEPSVVAFFEGAVVAVLALSVSDHLISRVYAVSDQRKLAHVKRALGRHEPKQETRLT